MPLVDAHQQAPGRARDAYSVSAAGRRGADRVYGYNVAAPASADEQAPCARKRRHHAHLPSCVSIEDAHVASPGASSPAVRVRLRRSSSGGGAAADAARCMAQPEGRASASDGGWSANRGGAQSGGAVRPLVAYSHAGNPSSEGSPLLCHGRPLTPRQRGRLVDSADSGCGGGFVRMRGARPCAPSSDADAASPYATVAPPAPAEGSARARFAAVRPLVAYDRTSSGHTVPPDSSLTSWDANSTAGARPPQLVYARSASHVEAALASSYSLESMRASGSAGGRPFEPRPQPQRLQSRLEAALASFDSAHGGAAQQAPGLFETALASLDAGSNDLAAARRYQRAGSHECDAALASLDVGSAADASASASSGLSARMLDAPNAAPPSEQTVDAVAAGVSRGDIVATQVRAELGLYLARPGAPPRASEPPHATCVA